MTRRVIVVCLGLLALGAAPAGATIVPGKGMAGVKLEDCQEAVISKLGDPDSTVTRMDFAGSYTLYRYNAKGLRITFRPNGDNTCNSAVTIFTSKGQERTAEGIGKGSRRTTLRAKLKGEHCRTYHVPHRVRTCYIGSFRPGTIVTDFRIDSKARVSTVSIGLVID
jgi:hypothetical protein